MIAQFSLNIFIHTATRASRTTSAFGMELMAVPGGA